jgi:hypothetical protein
MLNEAGRPKWRGTISKVWTAPKPATSTVKLGSISARFGVLNTICDDRDEGEGGEEEEDDDDDDDDDGDAVGVAANVILSGRVVVLTTVTDTRLVKRPVGWSQSERSPFLCLHDENNKNTVSQTRWLR